MYLSRFRNRHGLSSNTIFKCVCALIWADLVLPQIHDDGPGGMKVSGCYERKNEDRQEDSGGWVSTNLNMNRAFDEISL
jgi:hypothetical protein